MSCPNSRTGRKPLGQSRATQVLTPSLVTTSGAAIGVALAEPILVGQAAISRIKVGRDGATHHGGDEGEYLGQPDGGGGVDDADVDEDVGQVDDHQDAQEAEADPPTVVVHCKNMWRKG